MQILIIGLGSIGKKHIQVIRQLYPDCKIQAWRSALKVDEPSIGGVSNIYSFSEAAKPDFVIISNPTALHCEAIESVLAFACPLFIEKPIFHKIGKEEDALIAALEKQQRKTYVACNLRFHPVIKFFKENLSSDGSKIDEVTVYCGSYLPDWRPGTDYKHSYSANPGIGGGVHLDLIHELDYICYLFGHPRSLHSIKMSRSSLNLDSIDSARYLMEFPQFSVSLSLNYFRQKAKRVIEIVRDKDILSLDLLNASITDTLTNTVLFEEASYTIMDTYREQMKYFVDNNKGFMMNDVPEAVRILKLALS